MYVSMYIIYLNIGLWLYICVMILLNLTLMNFFCSYVSVIIKARKLKQHPGASKKRNGYRQICERHTVNSARQNE